MDSVELESAILRTVRRRELVANLRYYGDVLWAGARIAGVFLLVVLVIVVLLGPYQGSQLQHDLTIRY